MCRFFSFIPVHTLIMPVQAPFYQLRPFFQAKPTELSYLWFMKTFPEDKLLKRMLLLSLVGTLLLVTFVLLTDYRMLPDVQTPTPDEMALIQQKDSLDKPNHWHLLEWLNAQEIPSIFEWK